MPRKEGSILRDMKNKYLTRCLCITLISAMILSSSFSAMAAEGSDGAAALDFQADEEESSAGSDFGAGEETDVPVTPPQDSDTSSGEDITPAPSEDPTPTPDDPASPTPGETVTPTPGEILIPSDENGSTSQDDILLTDAAREVVNEIDALSKVTITLDHEKQIQRLRKKYDTLSLDEQSTIGNYQLLIEFETRITELKASGFDDKDTSDISDGTGINSIINIQIGTPVYYTNMVSNIHAGKEFYLDSLKNKYQLSFSDDFSSVMDSIEKEYKEKEKLKDASDVNGTGVTSSSDTLLVRNWQDIIAIYIYERSKEGVTSFTLDASCKDELAEIFEELNPVVRDKQNVTYVTYANRHINYYIKKNDISKEDRKILKKYVETDCKLLCATVTAARGFVRQSVGDDVSEERVNVITAAYSLIGKVGYFWGGKSTVLGVDSSWGIAQRVTAAGSTSTGSVRAYGLDCSGFVTWAVINGYHDQSMKAAVGDGTSEQWVRAQVVSEANAQPGDLVFQRGPEAGSDNHVGILCGKTDSGDWIAVHCSSGKNGVTVGEAYSAGFRYIRKPSFYPGSGGNAAAVSVTSEFSSESDSFTVNNSLQGIIRAGVSDSDDDEFSSSQQQSSDDVEVFIAQ